MSRNRPSPETLQRAAAISDEALASTTVALIVKHGLTELADMIKKAKEGQSVSK